MNYDLIITFLAIVEYGNVTKAANSLYISQGTASSRIQQLENFLQIPLFYRQPGIKGISLTPEGDAFLPLAQQWLALWQDMVSLKNHKFFREFRIAALNMFNSFYFTELYWNFMHKHSDIALTVQTEHSTRIHQLIDNQLIDIGFVFNLHNYPNVLSKPLFSENLVLLCHSSCPFIQTGELQDLNPENEIYAPWSNDFKVWHKEHFPYATRPKAIVASTILPHFMHIPDAWTIVTERFSKHLLLVNPDLCCLPFKDPPPKRTAYMLCHKYVRPWIAEIIEIFMEEVKNYGFFDPV